MTSAEIYSVLEMIAATRSRSAKLEILKTHLQDPLFKKVVYYALNPSLTYFVVPDAKHSRIDGVTSRPGSANFSETSGLFDVLDRLADRTLSGKTAVEVVEAHLMGLSARSAVVLYRILTKDLRAGFSAKTVNKIAPGTIPIFEVMLANKFDESKVVFPAYSQPKLDGVRAVCVLEDIDAGKGAFLTRVGFEIPSVQHLIAPICDCILATSAYLEKVLTTKDGKRALVLEGEITNGDFFEGVGDITSHATATDAAYTVFDLLPYDDFMEKDVVEIPYRDRLRDLLALTDAFSDSKANLSVIKTAVIENADEAHERFAEFRAEGLEGAMVKRIDAFYSKKRSDDWMKMKEVESDEYRIIDAFEGTGKYQGQLGGIKVDVAGVTVSVGGGFSDEQRKELWMSYIVDMHFKESGDIVPYSLLGHLAEVAFNGKTPDGSLRHPRFIKFRDDKDALLKETVLF